jgi:hypothetical protein
LIDLAFAGVAGVCAVFVVVRDRCASNNYPMVIAALLAP